VARIMRNYGGMSYRETLKLPIKTFWSLNRQVDRLRAEEDQRQLRLANAAQSAEGAKSLTEELSREIGTPVVMEKKFDADAFANLQDKFGSGRVVSNTHAAEIE
jgi:hypothetical protein